MPELEIKTMIWIEGKFVNEQPTPATHRFVGMWRPTFEQIEQQNQLANSIHLRGISREERKRLANEIPVRCNASFRYTDSMEGLHRDWLAGYYDQPIYERIRKD